MSMYWHIHSSFQCTSPVAVKCHRTLRDMPAFASGVRKLKKHFCTSDMLV